MNGADLDGHLNLYELSDLQPALASTGSSKLFQIFFATFKSMKKVKLKVKIGNFVAFFFKRNVFTKHAMQLTKGMQFLTRMKTIRCKIRQIR